MHVIIACPSCATRYVVPDSAIGVEGRTVRCAKCRQSWFQAGPEQPAAPPPPSPPPPRPAPPASAPAASAAAASIQAGQAETPRPSAAGEVAVEPEAAPPPRPPVPQAPPRVYSDETTARAFAQAPSSFAHEPPFRRRRNPLRLYTYAAAVFAVVTMGATAAVAVYGLPDWVPLHGRTFAAAQPDLVLEFPPNRQDRRTLPNGTEFFGASGKITNVGRERRSVPSILIVLRDEQNRIVYSLEIAPPKRQLAPGESLTINEGVIGVPRSARVAEIGWKPS
ncbi:zinc-ribbon domain-containing protein [Novosphingobium bradum]|uniref:Zinc-ribbon domain-containing protein n=1 Tax=Novosphingobium bradum TaxID=1737444 RepID=A0ABV7IKT1_9SPHN